MSAHDNIRVLAVLEPSENRPRIIDKITAFGSELQIVDVADGFHEAIALLGRYLPDILVADGGRNCDGQRLVRLAKKRWPQIWTVLLLNPAYRQVADCSADFQLSRWADAASFYNVFQRIILIIHERRGFLYAHSQPAGSLPQNDTTALSIRRFIEQNYDQPVTISTLAHHFNYAASTISRLYKEEFGISPIQYQKLFRIGVAKELLLDSPEREIQEIAAAVGYGDARYFSRIFHKEEGASPSEWLAMHRRR